MKLFTLILSLCLAISGYAQQPWAQLDNQHQGGDDSDIPVSMVNTTDGGYLLVGHSQSSFDGFTNYGGWDVVVTKFDPQGQKEWTKNYGGSLYDYSRKAIATQDGNYVIAGRSHSTDGDIPLIKGGFDYWIFKIDINGTLLWSKTYGGTDQESIDDIVEADDGTLYVLGFTHSPKADGDINNNYGLTDAWLVKLRPDGEKLWVANYGGAEEDYGVALLPYNGGFVCLGSSPSHDEDLDDNNGDWDVWLWHIDTAGNSIWHQNYGGSGPDYAAALTILSDGFLVASSCNSDDIDVTTAYGNTDIWVFKTDFSGNLIEEATYGGNSNDLALRMAFNRTGDQIYLLSSSFSNDQDVPAPKGNYDLLLLSFDPTGQFNASQNFGGSKSDFAQGMAIDVWGKDWLLGESHSSDFDLPGNLGSSDQWWFSVNPIPSSTGDQLFDNRSGWYPNPARDQLNFNGPNAPTTVLVRNLLGQAIARLPVTGNQVILPASAKGPLLLEWQHGGELHRKRIIRIP